jgi:hypothetical protein
VYGPFGDLHDDGGVDHRAGWDDPAKLRIMLDVALQQIAELEAEDQELRARLPTPRTRQAIRRGPRTSRFGRVSMARRRRVAVCGRPFVCGGADRTVLAVVRWPGRCVFPAMGEQDRPGGVEPSRGEPMGKRQAGA